MIYFYRAIAFKALKQAKKAILNYELYTRYSGKELPADTMYEIAVLCSSINNVNRAFYYYRLAAEKNGEILMRPDKGILDAARNRFETLFSLTSDDPHIISELAWIEYLSGNLERAKKLFLMLKETGRADVHVSAAQTMLQRLNNIDITSSTALAAADPKTADQATAADQTKAPIKEKPDAPRIIRNTGLAGETVKITEVTEKNQISNADLVTSDRHYENAEILLENKEYDRAFDEYEACLDLNPYNSEAALKIARLCHNKLKNTDDAVYFYKKYLALNSRDQSAYISISEILINEKNYDQALLWVNSAIQADPESEQIGYCNNLKNLVERRIAQAE
jgi:tetratricopeptide (TPR) repeat protein